MYALFNGHAVNGIMFMGTALVSGTVSLDKVAENLVEKRKKSITFYADSIRKAKDVAKNRLQSVAAEECSDVFSKQEASSWIDENHSGIVLKLYIAYTYLAVVIDPTSSLWEVLRIVEKSDVLSAVVKEPWLITQSLFILTQTPQSPTQVTDIIGKICNITRSSVNKILDTYFLANGGHGGLTFPMNDVFFEERDAAELLPPE